MSLADERPRAPRTRARRPALEWLESRITPAVIGPTPFEAATSITAYPAVLGLAQSTPNPSSPATLSTPDGTTVTTTLVGFTPQQIKTAYGISGIAFGSLAGDGAGQTIAIVDAYDNPYLVGTSSPNFATSDLARFDQAFGIPSPPSFTKIGEYGTNVLPGLDPAGAGNPAGNWETEEALDVEWAHAIAPAANLVLIEANSASSADLYQAISTAKSLPEVTVVSMSWGSPEYAQELSFDSLFTTPANHVGVTFVAATGDTGSPGEYPAFSPCVVAAGGTALTLGPGGGYGSESAWSGGGGGTSAYEPQPAYQQAVQTTGFRTTPDVSFDADPSTGVAICDQFNRGVIQPWEQMGGTSLATPSLAALFAIADQGRAARGSASLDGSSQTLPMLYRLGSSAFHEVSSGTISATQAGVAYDQSTGLGSPVANVLVPGLAGSNPVISTQQVAITAEPPANVAAGAEFGLTARVVSGSGALETAYDGLITITLASGPAGSLPGGSVAARATSGVAVFAGLFLTEASSGATLRVTAGAASVVSTPIMVTPAAPAALVVVGQPPAEVAMGQAFGLTLAIVDRYGNLVVSDNGLVALALAAGPDPAALAGQTLVMAENGIASFTQTIIVHPGAGYVIAAGSPNLALAFTQPMVSVAPPRPLKPHLHPHVVHPKWKKWNHHVFRRMQRHARVVHPHGR